MNFFCTFLMLTLAISVTTLAQSNQLLFNYPPEEITTTDTEKTKEISNSELATLNFNPIDFSATFDMELNLLRGLQYSVSMERIERQHPAGNFDIYYGFSGDERWRHLSHYRDIIMVINRETNQLVLHALTADGIFSAFPKGNNRYMIVEAEEWICDGHELGNFANSLVPQTSKNLARVSGCEEQDENGDYVVDMYFGFSFEAESDIGDINAYSVAQIETVNLGLQNSLIEDIYLRLVDVGVRDFHVGVIGSSISGFYNFFQDDFVASGADMAAFYDSAFPGANNGGGYAYVPGRASVNGAGSTAVFRHEWGHNSGSRHCPTDGGGTATYASGWNNGSVATHMCGNQINFFSNPNISQSGAPIGDATNGDNARNITERRTVYSGYATHITPYDAADAGGGPCPQSIADGRYTIRNVASTNYLSPVNTGNSGDYIDQEDTPATTENWEIHHLSNNLFTIYNVNTGRVLDVFSNSSAPGANVGLYSNNGGTSNQLWRIEPTLSGNFTITSSSNGLCLQIPSGDTADGDLVIQDACDGTTDTEWIFAPVTTAGDPPIVMNISATTEICPGNNGSITVTATGGTGSYTYAWSNGATTATASGLTSGDYTVSVTTGGRVYFTSGFVSGTPPLIPQVAHTDATPTSGGTISITNVQNANGSVSYAWSDGGSGATRTGLAGGIYTVTITDGSSCKDIRDVKIFDVLENGADYVIQHVASGLYVHPQNGGTGNDIPLILGDCPTDDKGFRWRADISFGNVFRFRNDKAGKYWTNRSQEAVGDSYRLTGYTTVNTNNFVLTKTGANTFTMLNNDANNRTSVQGNMVGDALVQTDPTSGTNDEFRFIPIVACLPDASGTACTDNDNTTDNDLINLLCACCGEPNACFGIGNTDGDNDCTDTDCNDTDPNIFVGSPCDDENAASIGDALDENCNCQGRPMTCSQTGNDLDNVALIGTASARNFYANSPTADVLTDGNTNGNWGAGEVWHSGAWYSWAGVELLQNEMVKEVTVYTRTDCCMERLNGVYVLVSDSPFTDEANIATLLTEADFAYQIPTDYDSFDPVTIPVGIVGKYIRLKAPDQTLNLAEIQVKTCPQGIVLPVELIEFTGEAQEQQNHLTWTTATEINNSGFDIERSVDGIHFSKIGFVAGAINSDTRQTYHFNDQNSPIGIAYYRLVQIDLDGKETVSSIISLNRKEGKSWQIFPNPVGQERLLQVQIQNDLPTSFRLMDLTGKVLKIYPSDMTSLLLEGVPAGVYLLKNELDGAVERVVIY